ncbi:hypothetical protein C8R44DRAFT_549828, partial [Mycena epipterygia]
IVLCAGNSALRVTKSILAARSPVFRTMFEFPQPPSAAAGTMMEGSPLVVLHDQAKDVEPFLRALFDSSYFMPSPTHVDLHVVLGILRLSHKYDVGYLYKRALGHLEIIYPINLANLDDHRVNKLNYECDNVAVHLKAIQILHEVGAVWLLPFAYYTVGTYPSAELLTAGEAWK